MLSLYLGNESDNVDTRPQLTVVTQNKFEDTMKGFVIFHIKQQQEKKKPRMCKFHFYFIKGSFLGRLFFVDLLFLIGFVCCVFISNIF